MLSIDSSQVAQISIGCLPKMTWPRQTSRPLAYSSQGSMGLRPLVQVLHPKQYAGEREHHESQIGIAVRTAVGAHAGVLTVSYEGTVYSADAGAGYEIGDSISGTLLIDTLLLGPDLDLLNPNAGVYGTAQSIIPSIDFITGFATGLPASDSIHVLNDLQQPGGLVDTYQIVDASGFGTPSLQHLLLHASLPADTLGDDGGVQIFEAISQGLGELVGTVSVGWEATRRQVDFYLSRLRGESPSLS